MLHTLAEVVEEEQVLVGKVVAKNAVRVLCHHVERSEIEVVSVDEEEVQRHL